MDFLFHGIFAGLLIVLLAVKFFLWRFHIILMAHFQNNVVHYFICLNNKTEAVFFFLCVSV